MLVVTPESMHLISLGPSSMIQLLVGAQLNNVLQLGVETEEDKLIRTATKSLCQWLWIVSRTLDQGTTLGISLS